MAERKLIVKVNDESVTFETVKPSVQKELARQISARAVKKLLKQKDSVAYLTYARLAPLQLNSAMLKELMTSQQEVLVKLVNEGISKGKHIDEFVDNEVFLR